MPPQEQTAEELTRQAEQKFRAIFDNTSDGIFLHDLQSLKLTMGNKSCLQMLGYTEEEFTKLSVLDLHPQEDLPFIFAQIDQFLTGGKPIRHDIRFKRKDGSILFADLSPDLVQLEGVSYALVALKDITERKRLEEELRRYSEHLAEQVETRTGELQESERRYRSLYHTIADGIFVVGADGQIMDVNDSACAQLGYAREELIGMLLSAVSARPAFHLGEIMDRLRVAGSLSYETAHRRKDGVTIPVELSVTLIEYRGQPAVLGVARDITMRKQAETALWESRQRLQAVVEGTSDAVYLKDLQGRYLLMNSAAGRFVGKSPDEVIGRDDTFLFPLDEATAVMEGDRRVMGGGTPVTYEEHVTTADGEQRTFSSTKGPILDADGKVIGLFGIARDITERKRAEEALQFTQFAVDHTADAAFWMTDEGRFFYVNEAACRALGYSREELLQMTVFDIDPAFTESLWHETWQKLEAGKSIVLETVHRARDGRSFPVEIRANYLEFGGRAYDCAFARDITERKRAEEALCEKEYLLSESQRIGRIGSWSVDLATGTATWSSETYQLYGVSPDTFTPSADALLSLLHPDDRAALQEWIRAALAGEHPGTMEMRALLPDGSLRILSGRGELVFAENHRPVRLVGTVQDVTEQKQAQEALRESEAGLAAAQRLAQLGSWRWDIVADTAHWSQETFRIFGIVPGPLPHHRESFLSRIVPEDRQRVDQALSDALSGARDYELDYRIRLPDGREKVIHARAEVLWSADGRPVLMHGTVQDITERKHAEEALRESEERFRTAFEEGAVPMALTALDSTLLKVNSSFCRMLGFSESELVGKSFAEITHPDDREANLVGTRGLACGERPSFHMEKRYIRKDGAVIWADMSTAAVRDAQGRPLYCVTHVQDITDRKWAQEALLRLNKHLEEEVAQRTEDLRRTVDQLRQLTLELSQAEDRERQRVADILHEDVQQTLAAARFQLNLLSSEPRSAEDAEEIVEGVKLMLKDAIEKSRSLSHELSPALYQVEMIEILNWLAWHMRQKHGLTVRVRAHGPVDVSSEPLKAFLYKVAQELLFNVVKHAGVNEAQIRVRRYRGDFYLSVVDRGRGFEPDKLERPAGCGLLSIRERVQMLGGRMKIKSTPGAGSRFLIALPCEPAVSSEYGGEPASSEVPERDQCAEAL